MRAVSRFEFELLNLLKGILGASVPVAIEKDWPRPECLSADCVALIKSHLRNGITRSLAERGWPTLRFLRQSAEETEQREGRVWERDEKPLSLEFSPLVVEVLLWITGASPGTQEKPPKSRTQSTGDRLFLVMCYTFLAETKFRPLLRTSTTFTRQALLHLLFPGELRLPRNFSTSSFDVWLDGPLGTVLEAWQPVLAQRWQIVNAKNRRETSPETLQQNGAPQRRILRTFLDAAESAGRRDLAQFLFPAIANEMAGYEPGNSWFTELDAGGLRLADRMAVYQSGTALLESAVRLRNWNEWARGIGYLDEEYQAAQLFKREWENANGEAVTTAARNCLRSMEVT